MINTDLWRHYASESHPADWFGMGVAEVRAAFEQAGASDEEIEDDLDQTLRGLAEARIEALNFSSDDEDFIFADWGEGRIHLGWLLSASREEIAGWVCACRD